MPNHDKLPLSNGFTEILVIINRLTKQIVLIPTYRSINAVTVMLWTSSHILYGLPLHQKGNVSKATY